MLGVIGQRNRECDSLPVITKRNSPRLRRARIKRVFKVVRAANRNFYFGVALTADLIVRDCDRANGRRGAIDGNLNGGVSGVGVDSGSGVQRTQRAQNYSSNSSAYEAASPSESFSFWRAAF